MFGVHAPVRYGCSSSCGSVETIRPTTFTSTNAPYVAGVERRSLLSVEDHRGAIPILDIASFRSDESSPDAHNFVEELRSVCHEHGFFSLAGHGVAGIAELQHLARRFFALPESE